MKRALIRLAAVGAVLAMGGFLLAWSGLVPVGASSGHWAITSWFLHFTMRQSVETRAMGIEAPPLDDPALVLRGAGHYASGCAPCHGAPGEQRALVTQQMTPPPPYLPPRIPDWEPSELFWIVKHGIKFTGMPAWVAQQRDDEVWAVVAFLQRLPMMTPREYRRLALGERAGEAPVAEEVAGRVPDGPLGDLVEACARCHGEDGAGRGVGAFPRLSLQTEDYLYAALRAYARGERHSGIMQPIAAGLDDRTMRRLARYYAGRAKMAAAPPAVPPQLRDRGERIARRGIPEQGVPACIACHGPKEAPRSPLYPRLAGQYAGYLALQLDLLKSGRRGGTAYVHVMRTIAERLTAEQIRAVAAYYGSLRPEGAER
jgi:cytochrome c553